MRVRGLTQDDAHIFCTQEQVEAEFAETVELTKFVLESVGLTDYRVDLSLRDPAGDKYVGDDADWDAAEATLRRVLDKSGMAYRESPGDAAFYGPKLDFQVRDAIGREWQLGTVQLDYNLPKRFELEYIGPDNKPHRPVMIHRAPFGSMERFVGMLIEHFAGAFPLWLAPEQVRVLPLSEKSNDYAIKVEADKLKAAGLRATCRPTGRQAAGEDSGGAAGPDPLHVRRRPAGGGSRGGRRARPDRRRPRRDAAGRPRSPSCGRKPTAARSGRSRRRPT